jgi:hypothetical protein
MDEMKYEVQIIDSPEQGVNYRVTHVATDSRIATCYVAEHAELICDALNAYNGTSFDDRELDFPEDELRDK